MVTWFAAKEPERTLHQVMYAALPDGDGEEITEGPELDAKAKVPLKAVLGSTFGLFLLVGTLSSMANNGITEAWPCTRWAS